MSENLRTDRRGAPPRSALHLVVAAGRGLVLVALGAALAVLAQTAWTRLSMDLGSAGAVVRSGTAAVAARFDLCHGHGVATCVVDGDTFRLAGETIRIGDIDTPETVQAKCADEARRGHAATDRLVALLNDGPFELAPWPSRDKDRYGRSLRIVSRAGKSLGLRLVDEGLARPWTGRRQPWC